MSLTHDSISRKKIHTKGWNKCWRMQEISMSSRQRVVLEFRTPQHPSLGTINWGGASPLLARNIPQESLENKYTRLNSDRTRDEIFPPDYDYSSEHIACKKHINRGRGFLFRFLFRRKEKITTVTLGSNSKKRTWFPRLDPQNRWPNGWCWYLN